MREVSTYSNHLSDTNLSVELFLNPGKEVHLDSGPVVNVPHTVIVEQDRCYGCRYSREFYVTQGDTDVDSRNRSRDHCDTRQDT